MYNKSISETAGLERNIMPISTTIPAYDIKVGDIILPLIDNSFRVTVTSVSGSCGNVFVKGTANGREVEYGFFSDEDIDLLETN